MQSNLTLRRTIFFVFLLSYFVGWSTEKNVLLTDHSITFTAIESCNLSINLTTVDASCNNTGGAIKVNIKGGKKPFKIEWDNSDNSVWEEATTSNKKYEISGLNSGVYSVKVMDANGCIQTENVTLSGNNNPLGIALSVNQPSCDHPTGSINIDIPNGAKPFKIVWDNADNSVWDEVTTSKNHYTISDLNAGIYTITVEDAKGCTHTKSIEISDVTSSIGLEVTSKSSACDTNGSISGSVSNGSPPYWIDLEGPVSRGFDITKNSFNIKDLPAGHYSLTLKQGSCKVTQNIDIQKSSIPLEIVIDQHLTCGKDIADVTINITGGEPNYKLYLDGPSTGVFFSSGTWNFRNLASGYYTITVVDAQGCTTTREAHLGIKSDAPIHFYAEGIRGVCGVFGKVKITGMEGGTGPYKLSWTGPKSGQVEMDHTGDYEITDLPKGDYEIVLKDLAGCIYKHNMQMDGHGASSHFDASYHYGNCGKLGYFSIKGMSGTAPYRLSWSGPVSNSVTMNTADYDIVDLPEGHYRITLEDFNGCIYYRDMDMGMEGNGMHFDAQSHKGNCDYGGYIRVKGMNGQAPYHLFWSGPVSNSIAMNDAGVYDIKDLPAGHYRITMRDYYGCEYYRDLDVENGSIDVGLDVEASINACNETGDIWVTPTGGSGKYTVSWTGPSSGSVASDSEGYSIAGVAAGEYTVSVVDEYGCSTSEKVIVHTIPGLSFSTDLYPGSCGHMGSIKVRGSGGQGPYQLSWSGPSSNSLSLSSVAYDITNLPSGSYDVVIQDNNGCEYSQRVTIGNNSSVGLDLEVSVDDCKQTGDIWVTPTGGSGNYTVAWTGPSSGSAASGTEGYSIAGVPAGHYNITLTDEFGCTTSEKAEVNTGAALAFNLRASDAINGKKGIISVHFVNGAEPHTVSWTGPVSNYIRTHGSSYDIINLPPGTYSITVTDANGCFHTQTVTVGNSNPELVATLNSSDAVNGAGGRIGVSIGSGLAPYTISWTGPVSGYTRINGSSYDISNLPPGTYSITITDADGIYTTKTITVGNRVVFGASITSTPSKCDMHGAVNVAVSGGQAPYTISWTGYQSGSLSSSNANTAVSLPSGPYTVSVEDALGQTTSGLANIGVADSDLYCSTHPNNSICRTSGSIFIIISGGKTPYQLKWDGPSAGGATVFGDYTISNLPSGVYTTKVIDAEGCSVMEMATVGTSPNNLRATIAGRAGAINIAFQSGTPNYKVSYSGPRSGNIVLSGTGQLNNLPAGLYRVNIEDANGCTLSQVVRVAASSLTATEDHRVILDNTSQEIVKENEYQYNGGTTTSNTLVDVSFETTSKEFAVGQNFPNPFFGTTTIPFNIPISMEVSLVVHDSYGTMVKEIRQDFSAGSHQFDIEVLSSVGVYYYTIIAGEESVTKRMTVIR